MNRKLHDLHESIAPEEIVRGHLYAFTFNPKDLHDWQTKSWCGNPWKDWINACSKLFDQCKSIKLKLYPEVSKLGRPHWHGYLKVVDVPKFFLQDIHRLKLNGAFEIDTISDLMRWDLYIRKGQEIWGPYSVDNDCHYIYISAPQERDRSSAF